MQITRGKVKKPFNVMLLGTQGIGKSTWAASAPNPIFITAEEIDELDAARLPQLTEFDQIYDQINFIKNSKDKFNTLCVDTLDAIEKLLHRKILESCPKGRKSMAEAHGGYGKAYERAATEMLKLRDEFKYLRDEMGMNLIFLCHTKSKKTADPIIGAEYDEFTLLLHDKIAPVFVDWVSSVLFATYVTHLKESDNSKDFALGDGERVILTERRPGHLAKNRYELPYEMEMPRENPIGPFMEYYDAFYGGRERSEKEVRSSIEGLLSTVQDENLKEKATKSYEKAKDLMMLKSIEKTIKERLMV